jgi:hypothetical protein
MKKPVHVHSCTTLFLCNFNLRYQASEHCMVVCTYINLTVFSKTILNNTLIFFSIKVLTSSGRVLYHQGACSDQWITTCIEILQCWVWNHNADLQMCWCLHCTDSHVSSFRMWRCCFWALFNFRFPVELTKNFTNTIHWHIK